MGSSGYMVWLVSFRALLRFMDGDSIVYPVVGTHGLFLLDWFTDPKDTLSALGSRARMDSKSGLHMFGEENREGDRFSSFIRSTITEPTVFGVAPHPAGHALCL